MLKSIQWKLVSMFVLLVVAIMLMLGLFLQFSITQFYYNNFQQQMDTAFNDELMGQLSGALGTEDEVAAMNKTLNAYAGRLGINTDRNFYILNKNTGVLLTGSDNLNFISKTPNILSAMADKVGSKVSPREDFLDYAIPVGVPEDGYIIYVADSKVQLTQLTETMLILIGQALLFGILVSIILAFFLSKTITTPIKNLTNKAEALAKGEYSSKIEIKADDEIGKLSTTFSYMAKVIETSLNETIREKNKMETILRYMTDGVIAFDTTGHVIHINPAAMVMLHIDSAEELLFDDFFAELNANISMAEMLYLEHYTTIERNITVRNKHYKTYFATFKVDNEKPGGIVAAIQDITESETLENSRREFVANVSHELRTPLTTIKSYAETLLDNACDEESAKFLSVINREVDRMTRIVKDLLTLSSLDHSKLISKKTYFSVDELLKVIVQNLSIDAKNHNHQLSYTPTTNIPPLYGDVDKIEQVIINILSNSIKYTPDGGTIDVFAGYLYNEAYIKIKDTGIGIPQKDLPHIFDRFYRVDKHRSRESGGTGLGLAIAQEIVRQHGGSISINSVWGEGTEVIIKLPIMAEVPVN